MSTVSNCEVPKHSKWHLISGSIVLLHGYIASVVVLRWWLIS